MISGETDTFSKTGLLEHAQVKDRSEMNKMNIVQCFDNEHNLFILWNLYMNEFTRHNVDDNHSLGVDVPLK